MACAGDRFRTHRGLVAPLRRNHVDTDQIIPKQFLKRIERSGFGPFLFHDWKRDPAFVLEPAAVRRRVDPRRRREFRLRLVARARRLGAAGCRLTRR